MVFVFILLLCIGAVLFYDSLYYDITWLEKFILGGWFFYVFICFGLVADWAKLLIFPMIVMGNLSIVRMVCDGKKEK